MPEDGPRSPGSSTTGWTRACASTSTPPSATPSATERRTLTAVRPRGRLALQHPPLRGPAAHAHRRPGRASLEAALAPAEGDWLYYVLADADGHHFFTDDADEFEAAVEEAGRKGLL